MQSKIRCLDKIRVLWWELAGTYFLNSLCSILVNNNHSYGTSISVCQNSWKHKLEGNIFLGISQVKRVWKIGMLVIR